MSRYVVSVRKHLRRALPQEPPVERAVFPAGRTMWKQKSIGKLGTKRVPAYVAPGRPGRFYSAKESISFGDISITQDLLREQGVYQIDRLLGWNVVPPTAIRFDRAGRIISAQQEVIGRKDHAAGYLEEVIAAHDKKKATRAEERSYNDFMKIALLDYIAGQQDRHTGNFIYQPRSGAVFAIDNELAFYPAPVNRNIIQHKLRNRSIPKELLADLNNLSEGDLKAAMAGMNPLYQDQAIRRLHTLIRDKKVLRWGSQYED